MILTISENDELKRLDSWLSEMLNNFSRSQLQKFIKNSYVKVNDKDCKSSYILKDGDKIEINIQETQNLKIKPENLSLNIIYEDENLVVVNKPSGMLTHPTTTEQSGTLVNALLYRYGENLSDINGEFRRGIVHRLDRNTSGLLIIAKNNKTHEYLAEQIKNHLITKKYRAILKGVVNRDEFTVDEGIIRNQKQPHKMMVSSDGKQSKTIFKVVKRYKDATAVELTLITGRTHQIRVHSSFINHPVFNDTLYGAGKGKVTTDEQVLQSYYLKFTKPFFDEIIELTIEPDEKYTKVINYLEGRK